MSKGRPICTKCPNCKRGKYGYDRPEKGVRTMPDPPKDRKRRPGAVVRTMTHVECLDCGHTWWSTLPTENEGS
jgi:hypothetical protein